jgi:bifunctional non-homologous end joining protein LigD
VIRLSDHFDGGGKDVLREACLLGLEGIVSKRHDAPYEHGRTRTWLKTKCIKRQEFVIGGFTDPDGSRVGIGALLVGVYDDHQRLIFAGKVGTGFSSTVLLELRKMLDRLEQSECPFANKPSGSLGRQAHWVRPELVAEVAFTEWTNDGKIRHPSFQGLRKDKPAIEVKKEAPIETEVAAKAAKKAVAKKSNRITTT